MREIELTPTKSFNGQIEVNEPVRVYDCSGPWGDPDFNGTVKKGLPALRRNWILKRGDVEESPRSKAKSKLHKSQNSKFATSQRPLRAKKGKVVTQLAYARAGIITPEMEFIAIREQMQNAECRMTEFRIFKTQNSKFKIQNSVRIRFYAKCI